MKRVALALFAAVVLVATTVPARVAVGQPGSAFTLSDISDRSFAFGRPRMAPLILIFTTKDLGDFSLAWRDSLAARLPGMAIESVLDLGDVSRMLRPVAKQRIRAKGTKAVLDWDGEVSERWRGEDRSKVAVFALAPNNVVRFTIAGNATRENVRRVVEAVRAAQGPAAAR